jgi:hypothetical protein
LPVKELEVLAIPLHQLARALVVASKHAAQHDKVGPCAKGCAIPAIDPPKYSQRQPKQDRVKRKTCARVP